KIKLTSIYVNDQEKALRFYTEVLGFAKKADFSQGPFRWLTVASSEDPDGTELQLALNNYPAARACQQAMFQQGLPAGHVPAGPASRPCSSRASPQPCSTPMTSRPTTSASKRAAPNSPWRQPRCATILAPRGTITAVD